MSFKDLIESQLQDKLHSALGEARKYSVLDTKKNQIVSRPNITKAAAQKLVDKDPENRIMGSPEFIHDKRTAALEEVEEANINEDMHGFTTKTLKRHMKNNLARAVKQGVAEVRTVKFLKNKQAFEVVMTQTAALHIEKALEGTPFEKVDSKEVQHSGMTHRKITIAAKKGVKESAVELDEATKTFKSLEDWVMAVVNAGGTISKAGNNLRANGLSRTQSATWEIKKGRGSMLESVELEEEKKLDPVGKADADIDNDGDVDSSDEYLHNRRKAIKNAIKKDKNEDKKQFMYAAKQAKEKGDKEFVFAGKKYNVEDIDIDEGSCGTMNASKIKSMAKKKKLAASYK